ncbi:MAG: hypothetical protein PHO37_18255, partial [Kiritimatiellae bacterium]|nr:hypothetical protein [Kiritimatiellia bacterium]
ANQMQAYNQPLSDNHSDMALLHSVREASQPRIPITQLISKAKFLVQTVCQWLYNRRAFCHCLILGVVLAYLVNPLPIVGPILTSLSISLSVLYGIGKQFQADLDRHFRFIIQGDIIVALDLLRKLTKGRPV